MIRTIFYTNTSRGSIDFETQLRETIKGIINKLIFKYKYRFANNSNTSKLECDSWGVGIP